jgi:hypothetical protein
MSVKVDIWESERGWGQRLDETKEFETIEQAKAFCDGFNADNNQPTVPDWYMVAKIRENTRPQFLL